MNSAKYLAENPLKVLLFPILLFHGFLSAQVSYNSESVKIVVLEGTLTNILEVAVIEEVEDVVKPPAKRKKITPKKAQPGIEAPDLVYKPKEEKPNRLKISSQPSEKSFSFLGYLYKQLVTSSLYQKLSAQEPELTKISHHFILGNNSENPIEWNVFRFYSLCLTSSFIRPPPAV